MARNAALFVVCFLCFTVYGEVVNVTCHKNAAYVDDWTIIQGDGILLDTDTVTYKVEITLDEPAPEPEYVANLVLIDVNNGKQYPQESVHIPYGEQYMMVSAYISNLDIRLRDGTPGLKSIVAKSENVQSDPAEDLYVVKATATKICSPRWFYDFEIPSNTQKVFYNIDYGIGAQNRFALYGYIIDARGDEGVKSRMTENDGDNIFEFPFNALKTFLSNSSGDCGVKYEFQSRGASKTISGKAYACDFNHDGYTEVLEINRQGMLINVDSPVGPEEFGRIDEGRAFIFTGPVVGPQANGQIIYQVLTRAGRPSGTAALGLEGRYESTGPSLIAGCPENANMSAAYCNEGSVGFTRMSFRGWGEYYCESRFDIISSLFQFSYRQSWDSTSLNPPTTMTRIDNVFTTTKTALVDRYLDFEALMSASAYARSESLLILTANATTYSRLAPQTYSIYITWP